jgi:death-on-curing family protein
MKNKSEVVIYQTEDGETKLEVNLQQDTVWLSLNQMVELFQRDKSVVSRHIHNIFREGELQEASVVANFATTAADGKVYQVDYFDLDVIISVGYRVKSQRGTQFRIWATNVLRDHLVRGYSLNEKRLREKESQLEEIKNTIRLIGTVSDQKVLSSDEALALINLINDYSYAFDVLDKYDHQKLEIKDTEKKERFSIKYEEAIQAINRLRETYTASELFGKEKDQSFRSSLDTIYQTFDGRELYSSIEEKAAHLLYFIVKNHSFVDGNKRIAAFIFIWFLEKNGLLYRDDGTKRIADNALVALTLMIAVSKPEEKETIIKVIVNLINIKNK